MEKSRTWSRRGREWGRSQGHGCGWGHDVTDVAEVTDAAEVVTGSEHGKRRDGGRRRHRQIPGGPPPSSLSLPPCIVGARRLFPSRARQSSPHVRTFPPVRAIPAFPSHARVISLLRSRTHSIRLEQVNALVTTWHAWRRHTQESHSEPDATIQKMPGRQGVA